MLKYLKFFCGEYLEDVKHFIKERDIKLVDVSAESYVEIKKELNKIADDQIAEGIETDFLRKNAHSAAYT